MRTLTPVRGLKAETASLMRQGRTHLATEALRIYDAGTYATPQYPQVPYLVMEIVKGKPLDDVIVVGCAVVLHYLDCCFWVLKVYKVVTSCDGLQSVCDHDDRH